MLCLTALLFDQLPKAQISGFFCPLFCCVPTFLVCCGISASCIALHSGFASLLCSLEAIKVTYRSSLVSEGGYKSGKMAVTYKVCKFKLKLIISCPNK